MVARARGSGTGSNIPPSEASPRPRRLTRSPVRPRGGVSYAFIRLHFSYVPVSYVPAAGGLHPTVVYLAGSDTPSRGRRRGGGGRGVADEEWTCGKGLAASAELPERMGELIGRLADVLENHTRALTGTDAN